MVPLAWGALALAGVLLLRSSNKPDEQTRRRALACSILGVRAGASEAEINAAWRLHIAEHHPDRGGDPDDAARLNAARDVLLSRS